MANERAIEIQQLELPQTVNTKGTLEFYKWAIDSNCPVDT